jgi:SAM-dependent methyltransferase
MADPTSPVWCRRHLEAVVFTGDRLQVTGWAASDGGRLLDFDVATRPAAAATRIVQIERADSPDVAAAFPSLAHAGAARFRATLSSAQLTSPHLTSPHLTFLRPRFEHGWGPTWCIGRGLTELPPSYLARVGGGAEVGLEFVGWFRDLAALRDDDAVLDLGCGIGRMAAPLAAFLGPRGRYVGLDVDAEMIAWARDHLAARDPRFDFRHVDARNGLYHPAGQLDSARAPMPLKDASITFAWATSLFTHLRRDDARHQLAELARVLQPGGRLLATFFLDPDLPARRGRSPRPGRPFVPLEADTWTTDPELPEHAIAFPLARLREWSAAAGLTITRVCDGSWSEPPRPWSFQDIVLYERPVTQS